ncbi:sel1 repeat family protein [Ensifer sp. NBAIM29]|nr:sel1 repeat family protein [Ensifer sp. NBAIM29]
MHDMIAWRAEYSCGRALAKAPGTPNLLYRLGRAYHAKHLKGEKPNPLDPVTEGYNGDFRSLYSQAAELGYAAAQFDLGSLYLDGVTMPKDPERAVYWFEKAAKQNLPQAQYALAQLYRSGTDVPKDMAKAFNWMREAADAGLPEAKQALGKHAATPSADEADGQRAGQPAPALARSLDMLVNKAESGDAEAQFLLALYLQHSKPMLEGGEVDYAKVIDLYNRAVAQGHVGASFALGRLYDKGLGVKADLRRAIELYSVAAEAGHAEAMGWLATSYFAIGDHTFAFIWASKAAQAGDPGGINTLGVLHYKGWATEKDYGKAMALYRRAADAGSCVALMNVGGLYYNGDGVGQDGEEAERWFQRARNCQSEDAAFISEYTDKFLSRIRSGQMPEPLRDARPGSTEGLIGAAVITAIAAAAAAAAAGGGSADVPGQNPPEGEWKAEFWCYTDFNDPDPVNKPTWCKNRSGGVWDRSNLFDPCAGVDGWCDGYGLGPKPGFNQ